MNSTKFLRTLQSPSALSLPVLLLQIPLALGLASSTRIPQIHQHPGMKIGLAWVFTASAALSFYAANWCLEHSAKLERLRAQFTLFTWLMAAFASVATTQFIHHLVGGEQIPLQMRLVNVPLMWIASIYGATVAIESRRLYREQFLALQQTTKSLREKDTAARRLLQSERQQLIETVRAQIKPELKSIASEIVCLQSTLESEDFSRILSQVDDYSIQTLRTLIAELNETEDASLTKSQEWDFPEPPKLNVSSLTLDPARSFRVALGIGLILILPMRGVRESALGMLNVAVILLPTVILNFLRTRIALAKNVPQAFWVLSACISVPALIDISYTHWLGLPLESRNHYFPVLGCIFIELSIILGAVGKYFSDAYSLTIDKQQAINQQLATEVQRTEYSRQVVRRDMARILHGPIQGRLAAVRMKLHLIAETSLSTSTTVSHADVNQLTDLLEQISHEIETFGDELTPTGTQSAQDSLAALAIKWQGMLDVQSQMPAEVMKVLDADGTLKRKIVAASSEAVTNAARHGKATQIFVTLDIVKQASVIELQAQDNGRGVPHKLQPGMGLQDIEADGGTWRLEPCASGAKLHVEFPLKSITSAPPVMTS